MANGDLLNREEKNDWIRDEWKSLSISPGMPYLFAGPYKTAKWTDNGMTFEIYIADENRLKMTVDQFEIYARIFQYGSELYGEPARPVYRLVGSAVAGVANSITNGHIIEMYRLEDIRVNAHEMAHTWWGGLVSTYGEGGEFLSEALAEFTARWILNVMEKDQDYYNILDGTIIGWKQRRYCAYLPADNYDPHNFSRLIVPANTNFRQASVRHWGVLVVNQIRQVLGDDVFFRCMRTFVDTFRGRQACIEDFFHTIKTVSGTDWTPLLKGMLYTSGFASYRVTGLESNKHSDGYRTTVRIVNKGEIGLPCPMLLKTVGGENRKTIAVEAGQEMEFTYTTSHRVLDAIIDPEMTTVLQYHPVQKLCLYKKMLETMDGYGNNEAYGASYLHYAQGAFDKAVEPVTDYLNDRMKDNHVNSIEEYVKNHGCNEYVFMRGIFHLAAGDSEQAEKDIKIAFPQMLDALEHDGAVSAPNHYYQTGTIQKKDLNEYLSLLGLIAGREFSFDEGMKDEAKIEKIKEWKEWWEQKGKQRKLDLKPIHKRFEAQRLAFRNSVNLTD